MNVRAVSLLLCLLVPTLAYADPMLATVSNTKTGALFSVKGDAPGYPNGTVVHVTLAVAGRHTTPNEVAFFQLRVTNESFAGTKTWKGQSLPPLDYEVRVVLLVSEQSPAIRRALRRSHDSRFDQRIELHKGLASLGEAVEQTAFEIRALIRFKGFAERLQTLLSAVQTGLEATPAADPAWPDEERKLLALLTAYQKDLRAHLRVYLAWRDQPVIGELKAVQNDLVRALVGHSKPGASRRRQDLIGSTHRLKLLCTDLETRLNAKSKPRDLEEGE